MNFKKEQGQGARLFNDILAEDLQHRFRQQLLKTDKIDREIETDLKNDSAYFVVQGEKYPNTTYAFGTKTLEQLDQVFEIFVKDYMTTLPHKCHVSFRQPATIEQEGEHYLFSTRIAVVPQ